MKRLTIKNNYYNCNIQNKEETYKEETNKEETNKDKKKMLIIIIPIIVAVIGAFATVGAALITTFAKSNHSEAPLDVLSVGDIEQNFACNKVEVETYINLEFICYEINSLPILSSYKVMPFPYIEVSKGGNSICIPLIAQFTQEEYVADSEGICVLRRENTTECVVEFLKDKLECDVSNGCYLAMEYISQNGDRHIGVYKLSNGQLLSANEKEAARIIYNTKDDDSFKINMLDWNADGNNINLYEIESKLKGD